MQSFKSFIREDQYLNNAGDKFVWHSGDIETSEGVSESILEDSENWLGTDKHDTPRPTYGDLRVHADNTKIIHKYKSLSNPEKFNLETYIASGYHDINRLNRNGKVRPDGNMSTEDAQEATQHLDSAIAKHTTEHPIHVWRGIHSGGHSKLKLGKNIIIKDKGFVSTSTHPDTAKHIASNWGKQRKTSHIMHIKIPKGSKALHVPSHTEHSLTSENEIILPRNSKFRYEGKEEHTNNFGKVIVHHLTHIPGES